MEDKINKVFNILEVEEYYANLLLKSKVCILLGCRVEKDEDEETTFVYSIGQYAGYNKGAFEGVIFENTDNGLGYYWINQGQRVGGNAIRDIFRGMV